VQQVLDSAYEYDRKVAFIGRSMVRNMGIARDLGLLRIPGGLVVGLEEATTLPPDQIVLMSTGSQGEPMSALGRMAIGDHRHITVAPGDTVVLASSLVPGNETSVYRVINQLSRAGAIVIHKDVAKVHVSGHSPAGELLYVLNVVRPSNLIPIHGEWRHLRAHARLGIESGVPADRVVLCEDGDVVDLVEGRARLVGHVKSRYVYVDGLAVGDVGESLLTERRILGDGGFIAATVVVDSVTGKVVGGPTVSTKGFSEDPGAFNAVIPLITEALDRAALEGVTDPHQLQQIVRRTVGRWVNEAYRRRPMIVPTVVEV
jgi:ribonuclease J